MEEVSRGVPTHLPAVRCGEFIAAGAVERSIRSQQVTGEHDPGAGIRVIEAGPCGKFGDAGLRGTQRGAARDGVCKRRGPQVHAAVLGESAGVRAPARFPGAFGDLEAALVAADPGCDVRAECGGVIRRGTGDGLCRGGDAVLLQRFGLDLCTVRERLSGRVVEGRQRGGVRHCVRRGTRRRVASAGKQRGEQGKHTCRLMRSDGLLRMG